MRNRIVFKDDSGSRKGCHPVTMIYNEGGRAEREEMIFLVDEPGAWWEDEWNCHVDGTDYPFKTRDECIVHGLWVLGYLSLPDK